MLVFSGVYYLAKKGIAISRETRIPINQLEFAHSMSVKGFVAEDILVNSFVVKEFLRIGWDWRVVSNPTGIPSHIFNMKTGDSGRKLGR